jgi:hypothetical protein
MTTTTKKTPVKKKAPVKRKTTRAKKAEATASKALAAVADLDAATVVAEVGELQVNLQTTLANLSAAITGKIEQMEQVDTAIGAKQSELTELYDIEQEAMSLDEVKQQREENDRNWENHVAEREKDWNDKESNRRQRWEREEEEHNYEVNRRTNRANEEHAALTAANRRREQIRQEDLERQWEEREEELKSREDELQKLRADAATFDEKIKAEVSKAEGIVGNRLKRQYEHEKELMERDIASQKALHAAEVQSLNQRIASLNEQLDEAQDALRAAQQDAKEVTSKALESASGRAVAQAVQKTVEMGQQSNKK